MLNRIPAWELPELPDELGEQLAKLIGGMTEEQVYRLIQDLTFVIRFRYGKLLEVKAEASQ